MSLRGACVFERGGVEGTLVCGDKLAYTMSDFVCLVFVLFSFDNVSKALGHIEQVNRGKCIGPNLTVFLDLSAVLK